MFLSDSHKSQCIARANEKLQEIIKQGIESERSEHLITLQKLKEGDIDIDTALKEIVLVHLKENINYYNKS